MSVSIQKTGVVNTSGEIGANLLSRYAVCGQNSPTNKASGGRTRYYGYYGIFIPATENADTYFSLYLKQTLTLNQVYTISCYVSGLVDGTVYNFPLFAQNNTSMGMLKINHNGLCYLTFTMTYTTQINPTSVGDEVVYKCFMDDNGRTIATGQGEITINNFKIEEGSVPTSWIPATTDPDFVGSKSGFNEEIGNASITSGYINATEFIEY